MPSKEPQPPQWYRVFQPIFDTVAYDPLDPAKRYDEGIFIEADEITREGTMFHVTGDIIAANGMYYEERGPNYRARDSIKLHECPHIGWVLAADYHSGRISEILRALPTPPKHKG